MKKERHYNTSEIDAFINITNFLSQSQQFIRIDSQMQVWGEWEIINSNKIWKLLEEDKDGSRLGLYDTEDEWDDKKDNGWQNRKTTYYSWLTQKKHFKKVAELVDNHNAQQYHELQEFNNKFKYATGIKKYETFLTSCSCPIETIEPTKEQL